MRRKFIALTMVLCLVFSLFTVTANAASKKKKVKYIKVNKATYQIYKKAYTQNKSLNNQIKAKNNTINAMKKQLTSKNDQINELKRQLANANAELDSVNSMNRWVWSNIKSIGITYSGKNWTIPKEVPEKFIIDGVTYTVTKEE